MMEGDTQPGSTPLKDLFDQAAQGQSKLTIAQVKVLPLASCPPNLPCYSCTVVDVLPRLYRSHLRGSATTHANCQSQAVLLFKLTVEYYGYMLCLEMFSTTVALPHSAPTRSWLLAFSVPSIMVGNSQSCIPCAGGSGESWVHQGRGCSCRAALQVSHD